MKLGNRWLRSCLCPHCKQIGAWPIPEVCEKCWEDALPLARTLGGALTEHYNGLLDERAQEPCKMRWRCPGCSILSLVARPDDCVASKIVTATEMAKADRQGYRYHMAPFVDYLNTALRENDPAVPGQQAKIDDDLRPFLDRLISLTRRMGAQDG